MTSRNLTEVFFLMRNNAIQNRNMYDDRVNTVFDTVPKHMDVIFDDFIWFLIFLEAK